MIVTDTPAGTVPTIEWITVDDGLIRTSGLIFHKEHWPAAVAELTRRSSGARSAAADSLKREFP